MSEVQITNKDVALKVLVQGINLAQSRGAFNLGEAGLLDKCIKMFMVNHQQPQQKPDIDIIDKTEKTEKITQAKKDELEIENILI